MPLRIYSATGRLVLALSILSWASCRGVMYTVVDIFSGSYGLATIEFMDWKHRKTGAMYCQNQRLGQLQAVFIARGFKSSGCEPIGN